LLDAEARNGWQMAKCKGMDRPTSEEDDQPPTKNKRGAVMIFLLGWLCLPVFAVALGELQAPWFQIGSVAMLASSPF
jgi:hypothetical protein